MLVIDTHGTSQQIRSSLLSNGSSDRLSVAGDKVNCALREARFLDQLADVQSGEWCGLGRLDNDGVAGDEGGCDLPDEHQEREAKKKGKQRCSLTNPGTLTSKE